MPGAGAHDDELLHAGDAAGVLGHRALQRDAGARRHLRLGALLLVGAVRRPLHEAEVADVARQRRLRHVVAARLEPRAQLFLARESASLPISSRTTAWRRAFITIQSCELSYTLSERYAVYLCFAMDTSSITERAAAPSRAGAATAVTGRHRRRERLRRPGAAALARRPSARARHGSDVVVAGRPAADAAGARENLGRRHRAVLGRQAGRAVRRRLSGAA